MADKTKIQWSDYTLNFLVGCSKVSAGCDNCYAINTAHSLEKRFQSEKYTGLTVLTTPSPSLEKGGGQPKLEWTGDLRIISSLLLKPIHMREPKKIFVNSMSDLFHEKAMADEHISKEIEFFFHVMIKEAKQHQYQILTKRPHLMRNFINKFLEKNLMKELPKNIWIGTSVENQKVADVRIPKLLEIPGGTKWLSCEPLLEKVDLTEIKYPNITQGTTELNCLNGEYTRELTLNDQPWEFGRKLKTIDWVVVGGESGPGARIMHMMWAIKIIQDCRKNNVPVFMKQMGSGFAKLNNLNDRKGGDINEWPNEWRVREFPGDN